MANGNESAGAAMIPGYGMILDLMDKHGLTKEQAISIASAIPVVGSAAKTATAQKMQNQGDLNANMRLSKIELQRLNELQNSDEYQFNEELRSSVKRGREVLNSREMNDYQLEGNDYNIGEVRAPDNVQRTLDDYGDMNNDGIVDIRDITMAREKIARSTPNIYNPDSQGVLRDARGRTIKEFDALPFEVRKEWSSRSAELKNRDMRTRIENERNMSRVVNPGSYKSEGTFLKSPPTDMGNWNRRGKKGLGYQGPADHSDIDIRAEHDANFREGSGYIGDAIREPGDKTGFDLPLIERLWKYIKGAE